MSGATNADRKKDDTLHYFMSHKITVVLGKSLFSKRLSLPKDKFYETLRNLLTLFEQTMISLQCLMNVFLFAGIVQSVI